jgi:ParB-like chromosome segregation protein Spo0J
MSTSVTPTAIDAYVPIESVVVVGRHRKHLGDLDSLADSILDVGLLNPITITPSSRLVAGQRRLEACRRLGWDSIPTRIAESLDEASALLRAERDENTERLEMLPSEKAALGAALESIEAPFARSRQGARTDLGYQLPSGEGGKLAHSGETTAIVGETLGMSRSSYADLRFAHKVANDPDRDDEEQSLAATALSDIDRGAGLQPTVTKLRTRLRARQEAAEVKAAALVDPKPEPQPELKEGELDPSWVPPPRDSSPTAVKQRRALIAYHAGRGLSSPQISEIVGVADGRVREIARKHDIAIRADEVMARTRRIDSNRVVRETVSALEGLALGAQLVNVTALDPAEIDGWAASMTASIRALNRLVKQLKEQAREA